MLSPLLRRHATPLPAFITPLSPLAIADMMIHYAAAIFDTFIDTLDAAMMPR
jgi:hypothetical protein